jgi:hypothetical protein
MICKRYINGESTTKIAKDYIVNPAAISYVLHKNNIKIRSQEISQRKYALNVNFFDEIDSEEKAYVLGFLGADGYNNQNRGLISLHLKQDDDKFLEKINKVIGSNNPIKYTKSSNSANKKKTDVAYLRAYSKHMSKIVAERGIVQRKSEIYEFPEWLDENLVHHYLRGYFDGDGCFSNKSRKRAAFTGSINFCEVTMKLLREKCGIEKFSIRNYKKKSYKTIYIHGYEQIEKLINYLYKDATIYMDRKKKIADEMKEQFLQYYKEQEVIKHKTCSLCDRPFAAKGMCMYHYKIEYKKENKEKIKQQELNNPRRCDFCDNPHAARGMCRMHYKRWKKGKLEIS